MKAKILIIEPSLNASHREADINYKTDIDYFHKSFPLGALAIGSYLKKNNYDVHYLDCRFYSKQEVFYKIDEYIKDCLMVGFSIMTPHIGHGLVLTNYIKQKYKIPILWGGHHPSFFPEQTLQHPHIDYIIAGEGELPMSQLLETIRLNEISNEKLSKIIGLGYKNKERIYPPQQLARIEDLNALPDIDYSILELEKYLTRKLVDGRIGKMAEMVTSRGCPYRCKFCINTEPYRRPWKYLTTDKVIHTMKTLVEKYNVNHIEFMDDFFFGKKERVNEIAGEIIRNKLSISWSALPRADSFSNGLIDEELLIKIKQSGCKFLRMGMESGSEKMLKIYNKNITPQNIINAVYQCKKFGIYPLGAWMMGGPGEDTKDVIQTLKLIWRLHKIDKNFFPDSPSIFRPFPGSELYKELGKYNFQFPNSLEEWADYRLYKSIIKSEEIVWFEDPDFLNDVRFYGLVFLADYKGYFDKGFMRFFKLFSFIIKLRYALGWFEFRFEPWLFKIFKKRFNQVFRQLKLFRYFDI